MDFTQPLYTKIIRILVLVLAVTFVSVVALKFTNILLMVSLSFLLYLIFNPLVSFFERNGIKRIFSVLLVFAISGVVIVLVLSILIPKIAGQMNAIAATVNRETLTIFILQIEDAIKGYIPLFESANFAAQLGEYLSTLFFSSINSISDIVSGIVSVLAISIIVPFMTFFILKDQSKIVKSIMNVIPNKYFEMSYAALISINNELGRFVRGWIFDAFIVGVMASVGLAILGIENSITIGFVAGIGHLIPYFGPVIGGLPAIIISLIQFGDFSMLPSIVLMFVIIYTLDNGYIQPNVFSKSTDMHPLMIIVLILVGSQMLGILGMLLAVPVATVLKTAAREIYYGFKLYQITRV